MNTVFIRKARWTAQDLGKGTIVLLTWGAWGVSLGTGTDARGTLMVEVKARTERGIQTLYCYCSEVSAIVVAE